MTDADPAEVVFTSFAEVLTFFEHDDFVSFHDSLDGEFEPYFLEGQIVDEDRAHQLDVNIQNYYLDQCHFTLKFPCTLEAFQEEWTWLGDYYDRHSTAMHLATPEFGDYALGEPAGTNADVTDATVDLAEWLDVDPTSLAELLAGTWPRTAGGQWSDTDADGKKIFHWFAVPETCAEPILIGIGGDAVYVARGTGRAVAIKPPEHPEPTIEGAYYWGNSTTTREHKPVDVLGVLRVALAEAGYPHDVVR
jgi:hypothetical protein